VMNTSSPRARNSRASAKPKPRVLPVMSTRCFTPTASGEDTAAGEVKEDCCAPASEDDGEDEVAFNGRIAPRRREPWVTFNASAGAVRCASVIACDITSCVCESVDKAYAFLFYNCGSKVLYRYLLESESIRLAHHFRVARARTFPICYG
jgi:hypothetical protein